MTAPNDAPGDRLERALEAFLAAPPTTPADVDRLLDAHADLRDLLEPMLEPRQGGPQDDSEVLGDYRLLRELGRGGMGVVHEAWQRSLDRRVAVKVLTANMVSSPQAIARFRREASAVGRLDHPHIVEVYGFGHDAGRHFFAMQFVDGVPLHEVAARFRAPERAVAIVRQVADALAHAHSRGLVHRDVKPGNVLVTAADHAFLTDFGIAHDESLPSLTHDGSFLGTPDYASPEQLRGTGIDARTD
ncbi:MAG: serine/threonine protein kinase, partial [Planctomycetes bacterium]|nr:serine/threonine protein kinase [Planctomycetota bacterium]